MKLFNGLRRTLIVGAIITTTAISTLAQTQAQASKSTLTLQQAVNRAITSCDKKEVYGSYIEAYEEINKYNVDYFSAAYRNSKNNQKLNEYYMKHINEAVAYDATDLYLQVISLNKKIEKDQNTIVIKEKELKAATTNKKNGLISELEYKNAESALAAAKSELVKDKKSLETAALEFRNLTNMDILSYQLEENFAIEPAVIKGAPSSYFETSLQDYWNIQQENIDITQIGRDELYGGTVSITTGEYRKQEASLTELEYNLKNSKENVMTSLMTSYNSLTGLAESVKTYQEKLALSEKSLKAYEIKLERGMISKLDYEKKLLEKQELETATFDVTKQYIITKTIVENPTVLVMSAGR